MSYIHRRQFLRSTAAVAAASLIIPSYRAEAGLSASCGCCGSGRAFTLASLDSSAGVSGLAASSGDQTTDQFLGRALVRLATTLDVQPGFLFFDDSDNPNAIAKPETLIPGTVGTVLMGKRFFSEHMQLGDDGVTVIAVCAHEFGHMLQMKTGLIDVLGQLDKTVRPIELHADFLAGAFLAARKQEYPNLNLRMAGETFVEMGENNFTSPTHHGTAQERIAAVTAGYDFVRDGADGIDKISAAGVAFVKQIV
jgi:hypothetical protein